MPNGYYVKILKATIDIESYVATNGYGISARHILLQSDLSFYDYTLVSQNPADFNKPFTGLTLFEQLGKFSNTGLLKEFFLDSGDSLMFDPLNSSSRIKTQINTKIAIYKKP